MDTTPPTLDWLRELVADRLGIAADLLEPTERLHRYGLTSLTAASVVAAIAQRIGRPLPPTLMWDHPTLARLAAALEGRDNADGRAPIVPLPPEEPIAIVGLACRFPGADGPDAFWRLLCDGIDAIAEVPADRWPIDALYDPDPAAPGRMATRWGGFLDAVDRFDAGFFGLSPREAAQADPQQRLALELAWEALEDAGLRARALTGSRTGVFMGAMWSDYARLLTDRAGIAQHTATGQDISIVSARIAYFFGLEGPALTIDTACSSALVAVHQACRSLRSGESTLALAGGVHLVLAPESSIAMTKFGAMAPDGRCKPFDAGANGYVRGEGGGVIVLKPLSRALVDGDRVYAVVRGSAVNNDGPSNGLTAPNPAAQRSMLRDALADARLDPLDLDYVEAHGTGTALGDPIEAQALAAVLCRGRAPDRPLRIGSVKSNIGHLEAAAGAAGLIKLALALRHRWIPATLHYRAPNPAIDFAGNAMAVQASGGAWPAGAERPAAGVSSFGFGGTNAHVVLQAAPATTPRGAIAARPVFVFAGNGGNWAGMARALREEPVFAAELAACDAVLAGLGYPAPVTEVLEDARVTDVALGQPALCAFQLALAALLAAWDVQPAAVVGHSVGEAAAACVAGALTRDEALRLVVMRARLQASVAGQGGMALVAAPAQDLAPHLPPDVVIAGENGPRATLIAAAKPALAAAFLRLDAAGLAYQPVDVPVAYHSPQMDPLRPQLERALAELRPRPTAVPMVSTVTGQPIAGETLDAAYWGANLRAPVRFRQAIASLREAGHAVFLELAPHPLLAAQLRQMAAGATVVAPLRRGQSDAAALRAGLAPLAGERRGVRPRHLLLLSARSPAALDALRLRWAARLPADFADLCHTALVGRERFAVRLALHAADGEEARRKLRDGAVWQGEVRPGAAPAFDQRRGPDESWEAWLDRCAAAFVAGAEIDGAAFDADEPWQVVAAPTYPFERSRHWLAGSDAGLSYALGWEPAPTTQTADARDAEALDAAAAAYAAAALASVAPEAIAPRHRALAARLAAWAPAAGRADPAGVADRDAAIVRPGEVVLPDTEAGRLLRRAGEALPALLTGAADPLEVLFPAGDLDAAFALYSAPPFAAAQQALADRLAAARRPLRVLELGAGTGALTARLLATLPAGSTVLATDLSDVFLTALRRRFADHPGLRTARFDLDDPTPLEERFDAVVAANVVHAGGRIGAILPRLSALLAPGGWLGLVELLHAPRWIDLVFGLTEGWWRFQGDPLRPAHALMDADRWTEALHAAGFVETRILPDSDAHGLVLARTAVSAASDPEAPADALGPAPAPGEARGHAAVTGAASVLADMPLPTAFDPSWCLVGSSPLAARLADRLPVEAAAPALLDCPGGEPAATLVAHLAADADPRPRTLILGPTLAHAAVAGAARAVSLDRPGSIAATIELADDAPATLDALTALVGQTGTEDQWRIAAGTAQVARLHRVTPAGAPPALNPERLYVIAGGFGRLGQACARYLVAQGARHLLLVGRTPRAVAIQGATIRSLGLDLTAGNAAPLRAAMDRPLGGIVHAAGIADGPAETVLAAKLAVADTLAAAAEGQDPGFLLLFSSAAGVWGTRGHVAYAAANRALDRWAEQARARGLPATAIAFGRFAEPGLLTPAEDAALAEAGLRAMSPDTGFEAAFQAVAEGAAHRIVADIDWPRFLAAFEARRPRPLFAPMAALAGAAGPATSPVDVRTSAGAGTTSAESDTASSGRDGAAARGAAGPSASAAPRRLDRAEIAALLANLLGHPDASRIDPERGLFEQGLDSLMAVTLRRQLEAAAGVPVPAAVLFAHPTVAGLADWLAGQARAVPASAAAPPTHGPVAIIGLGCRFPGAHGPAAFADRLFAGGDAVRLVPPDRPTAALWAAAPETVRRAGFLDGVERFDAAFFGISPREAAQLDPQQRLLLTTAWEALEHAGLAPDRLAGSRTGVFVGATGSDYATLALDGPRDAHSLVGQPSNTLAGRLAYQFGLHGPALTVDTACSSSLVALHLAIRALRTGEADLALAAGVNLLLAPETSVMLANAGLLSPNARCAAFDATADGYVRGEGVGVLVLKPLARAEADGDRVLAVIAGSASNHDGRSSSFTAPNGSAQAAVIRDALADAGLSPAAIDAIEAHGTGTQLGDPIELDALAEVFAGRDRPLLVGSVKAAIGHTEAAAGLAGVIKSVLCLQRGALPAQPHYATRNPHARAETPVLVAGEVGRGQTPTVMAVLGRDPGIGTVPQPGAKTAGDHDEPGPAHPVMAVPGLDPGIDPAIPSGTPAALHHVGVSAFGASGTNAHVVLSATTASPPVRGDGPPRLLLSAATPEALERLRAAMLAALAEGLDFANACHTAWVGRARLRHWLLADSPATLATATAQTGPVPDLATPRGRRITLPQTPLDPLPFWLAAPAPVEDRPVRGAPHHSARSGETVWETRFDPAARWLRDHRVHETVVMPGAAFLTLALEVAPEGLTDVAFLRRLDVPPEGVAVQLVRARDGAIALYADLDGAWAEIATARAADAPVGERWRSASVAPSPLAGEGWGEGAMPPDTALPPPETGAQIAADLAARGFDFGPSYRLVDTLRRRGAHASATLTRGLPPDPARGSPLDTTRGAPLDPMLIDAALQTLTALLPPSDVPFLPARIGRVVPWADQPIDGVAPSPHPSPARGEGATPLRVRVRVMDATPAAATGDAALCLADGTPILALEAVTLLPAPAAPGAWTHDVVWRPAADPATPLSGRWHAIGPGAAALGCASHDETGTAPLPTALDGIVDLRPLQPAPLAAAIEATAALVRAAAACRPPPRLVLVSRGASTAPPVLPGPVPAAAALMGLQPVIDAEHPGLRCRWVDLDPDDPSLCPDLGGPAGRYALRQGRWLTPERVKAPPPPAGPVRLAPGPERSFADLRLLPDPDRAPGAGEVRIAVSAAGLNFKDVLTVLGRLPDAPLGLECAGTVVAVGPDVTGFAPGDPVLGFGPGALATAVTLPATRVLRRPAWLDADTAATLPVALLTAWYGLHELAQLRPGMRVLVHAGAGGVGSMAIQLARAAGARVFATVSAGKEHAARAAGAEAVGDSRSPAFAAAARAWAGPDGIDVVLNALGPEIAVASAALLAPGGVFLEIGNAPRPEGVARWIAYDLDRPMAADPGWFADRMTRLLALLQDGRLRPPRRSVFPLALAGEALQAVAQGRTIGKLVLRVPTPPAPAGTWLVTGGTGAVGRAIAQALRAAGIPRVVVAARTPTPVVGCETVGCDVTAPAALAALLGSLPDLSGVVHAAGVVRDGMLKALNPADLAGVLAPKAGAAALLDRLMRDHPHAPLVLVSSSAGTLGGAGQGAYAAANAWLDRLAAARRAEGLPAVAIGSGPWAGGMFARLDPAQQARLARDGLRPMAPARAAAAVLQALAEGVPHRLVMDYVPPQPAPPLADGSVRASLLAAPPAERLSRMQQALAERLVALLGFPAGTRIAPDRALRDLGLDSLLSVSLRNELAASFGLDLPATLAFDHPTLAALAAHLLSLLADPEPALDTLDAAALADLLAAELGSPG